VETIGSKRSYALTWCMPNNDDDEWQHLCGRSCSWTPLPSRLLAVGVQMCTEPTFSAMLNRGLGLGLGLHDLSVVSVLLRAGKKPRFFLRKVFRFLKFFLDFSV